jgi:hypothetical protein
MVGARTGVHVRAGNLEVESTQDLQTCLAQPVRYPVNRIIAGMSNVRKGEFPLIMMRLKTSLLKHDRSSQAGQT